jgi:hypothetical protein
MVPAPRTATFRICLVDVVLGAVLLEGMTTPVDQISERSQHTEWLFIASNKPF